jgi:Predicted membrane protein
MKNTPSSFSVRGAVIGLIGLVIITSSSLYVALKMGALPWPTVFVTVLSMVALKRAKGVTIQEVNTTHTLMSAGAMVAGGLAFTLPGLWILAPDANIPLVQVIILSVTGAVLGTLFTSIFRLRFIEKEKLPYPIGMSSYTTLKVGMEEGKGGKTLFASLGASAVFTFLRDKLMWIPAVLTPFKGTALFPSLSIWVSPMAFGIGAIIGPVLALVWFLGTVLGYYVLTPIGLGCGFFASMAEADAFRSNLGIGLMVGTGIGVFLKAIINLIRNKGKEGEKKSLDKNILIRIAVTLALAVVLLSLTTAITPLEAVILIVGVFLATYLSGMLTGQTGVNPMEIFAILVVLAIALISRPTMLASFSIAAVVAIACGLTGDVMNDLKSGYMLKNDPKSQMLAEGIGGVAGAVIAAFVLFALKGAFGGFGNAALPAPQASAVATMIGGMGNNTALIIGIVIGIILLFTGLPTATLGLGVYLPNYISSIMALGALSILIAKKAVKDKNKLDQNAALVSSGLLGGEGITGVLIAIFSMLTM